MDKLIRAIKKFGKVIEALTELALKAGTLIAAVCLLLQML